MGKLLFLNRVIMNYYISQKVGAGADLRNHQPAMMRRMSPMITDGLALVAPVMLPVLMNTGTANQSSSVAGTCRA